ncbi:MAG TPA: aminotransferase class I/II-fold pyridoxal phosphate-dependent enzyme [Steroidobacteraceae bacterium]|nr:aminotransferase class I/II-fold pyridoxal phosphate-dependent enzyme [Steroidobacteraceae bacterium]
MSADEIASLSVETQAVWAAETGPFPYGAAVVPIVQAATFAYQDLENWRSVALRRRAGHIYSRNSNPTLEVLERKIAALDGTESAVGFTTGMAAISSTLFALLSPGDRLVSIRDSYGGTNVLFEEILPRFTIETCLCDTTDMAGIESEIRRGCRLVYLETPTNPTLKIVDIERLARAAHREGASVVTDNTFATPCNQRPAALGSDLVVYSATKFLAGHSDVLGGLVSGSAELVRKIYHFREIAGATLHAEAAYAILRGMKTLALRMARHNSNALCVAEHLARHPKVAAVHYPGLTEHPGHAIARRQMRGYGGVLSFEPRGGLTVLDTVLDRLRLAQRAAHLGGVATTAGPPSVTSHVELTAEERARAGIPETLIRYSAGIEDPADLIADLDQALAAL